VGTNNRSQFDCREWQPGSGEENWPQAFSTLSCCDSPKQHHVNGGGLATRTEALMYAPLITSARRVREHIVGPKHTAVLLTDVESSGQVEYEHLLVLFEVGRQDPIAFISSEVKDDLFEEKRGSHYLCAFIGDEHSNFGESDDWADLDRFEEAALDLIRDLHLTSTS
jgi:hypothetical protein